MKKSLFAKFVMFGLVIVGLSASTVYSCTENGSTCRKGSSDCCSGLTCGFDSNSGIHICGNNFG